jgi:hypothetical protein
LWRYGESWRSGSWEKNNEQIAQLLLDWIKEHVDRKQK